MEQFVFNLGFNFETWEESWWVWRLVFSSLGIMILLFWLHIRE